MRQPYQQVAIVTGLLVLIAVGIAYSLVRISSASAQQELNPYMPTSPMLPPSRSVSGYIWLRNEDIPAEPIDTIPQFVDYPTPEEIPYDMSLIEEAGCSKTNDSRYQLLCPETGPLNAFDCTKFEIPFEFDPGLDSAYPLVAKCKYNPNYEDAANDKYLYRTGCMLLNNVGFIFKIDDEYVLVNTPEKMQEIVAPIESPEEALSYARMLTGMHPMYEFSYEPNNYTIFFLDVIVATHVTETTEGYIVHLYHTQGCGCSTWTTSQVDVVINYDGSMEWGRVTPVYQGIAEGSCVD